VTYGDDAADDDLEDDAHAVGILAQIDPGGEQEQDTPCPSSSNHSFLLRSAMSLL
jgi:hypothetical protein